VGDIEKRERDVEEDERRIRTEDERRRRFPFVVGEKEEKRREEKRRVRSNKRTLVEAPSFSKRKLIIEVRICDD